ETNTPRPPAREDFAADPYLAARCLVPGRLRLSCRLQAATRPGPRARNCFSDRFAKVRGTAPALLRTCGRSVSNRPALLWPPTILDPAPAPARIRFRLHRAGARCVAPPPAHS